MSRIGRNDPCHCGSGKKYKKCHQPIDEAQVREMRSLRTLPEWVAFYGRALCDAGRAKAARLDIVDEAAVAFYEGAERPADPLSDAAFAQHALFDLAVDGDAPVIASIDPASVSPEGAVAGTVVDLEQIAALRDSLAGSHASLLEVTECKRGRGLRLADRLTGAEVFVYDGPLSKTLDPMEVVAGRIVQMPNGAVLFDGWTRVAFRGRKRAIRELREQMAAAGLADDDAAGRTAWLRREAPRLYRQVRAAAAAAGAGAS